MVFSGGKRCAFKHASRIDSGEIAYFAAEDDEVHYITNAGVKMDGYGNITDKWVPVRYQGEFLEAPTGVKAHKRQTAWARWRGSEQPMGDFRLRENNMSR